MKYMRNLFSTTPTLRHLFLPSSSQTSRISSLSLNRIQSQTSPRLPEQPRRYASYQSAKPAEQNQFIDERIRAKFVQIVNEENKLGPPEHIFDVLRSIERPTYFLQQVSPSIDSQPPICKIVNRVTVREHEKARAKAAHAAKASLKQVELNWAIDAHDLSHRLKQLKSFLLKGRKVEIFMKRKKGKRAPTVEEIKHLLDSVEEAVKSVGAAQVKPSFGEPGKQVIWVVEKRNN